MSAELQPKKIRIPCSLREIVDCDLFFFDKTLEIIKLTKILHSQAFIARPRHFGKTLTIDILYNLFTGNRAIFEKLQAKCLNEWDFSQRFTVLLLNFNINIITYDHFAQTLKNYLWTVAKKYNLPIQMNPKLSPTDILSEILDCLTEKRTKEIIILIDDFDYCLFTKPPNSSFKPYVALLGSLVNIFKVYQDNIRLLLYFGIHYFTSNTIGNFFTVPPDISTDPELASVFGFTREEVLDQFSKHLDQILPLFKQSKISNPVKDEEGSVCETVDDIVDYLIYYYGGYRFSPYSSKTVLNPYETLNIFQNSRFNNYWIKNIINLDYIYSSSLLLSNFYSIFSAFFNFESFFIDCLVPLIKGDYSITSSAVNKYRYIIDYGFLTYDLKRDEMNQPMLSVPNTSMYELLANILIQKLSERYCYQLKPYQIDKVDQGNIPQIIEILRFILIAPLVPPGTNLSNNMSNQSVSVQIKNKDNLLAKFQTWEIKVFAALASLGIRVTMKLPQSDCFYHAVCETSRSVINILSSTNSDPSIKQILPLLDYYGRVIPPMTNKNNIFCVLSCTTFSHTIRFDATWNIQQNSNDWILLIRKICTSNHDYSQIDMSQFCNYETTFFQTNEDMNGCASLSKKPKNLVSFIDVVFQIFLDLDSKQGKNKLKFYSVEQITTIVVKIFSNSQPFNQLIESVKMSVQFLFETNKLVRIISGDRYLYGVKK